MKQDADWKAIIMSHNPLLLYQLIEKMVLAQMEDQYPFVTVYEQEMVLYSFQLETLSNAQYYKHFNTKVDVTNMIGVTQQHKVLLEYIAQDVHQQAFVGLTAAEQQAVHMDAEEQYLLYVFLQQSAKQHTNLKTDLQHDFTTRDNRYLKNWQQTLHLLDKYSKPAAPKTIEDMVHA